MTRTILSLLLAFAASLLFGQETIIRPNPTDGVVVVVEPADSAYTLVLNDALGNTVLRKEGHGTEEIDLSSCEEGVYFVSLLDRAGHKETYRLVIDR